MPRTGSHCLSVAAGVSAPIALRIVDDPGLWGPVWSLTLSKSGYAGSECSRMVDRECDTVKRGRTAAQRWFGALDETLVVDAAGL